MEANLVMRLLIRYSPMASYFYFSIILLAPQILQHAPHRHDLPHDSCDHHRLYPIPLAPLAQHHVVDFPYDLWTSLFYFPFLVPFLLPNTSCCGPTDHKPSHHMVRALPSVSPHTNLVLVLLIICLVSILKKKEVFPPEFRLSVFCLVVSPCSTLYL